MRSRYRCADAYPMVRIGRICNRLRAIRTRGPTMKIVKLSQFLLPTSFLALALLPGCTYSLVHDNPTPSASVVAHCEGTENVDDSSIAVIPVPIVAFLSPHANLHNIEPEDYLNRCGPPTRLVN